MKIKDTIKERICKTTKISPNSSLFLLLTIAIKLSVIPEGKLPIFLLGEPSLGKSYLYELLNELVYICAETITPALLRGNATVKSKNVDNLDSDSIPNTSIFSKDIAVIEEFSTLSEESLAELKNFLISFYFNYRKQKPLSSNLSLICTGNSYIPIHTLEDLKAKNMLADFPPAFKDYAFHTRLFFIPHYKSVLGEIEYSGEISKDEISAFGKELFKLRNHPLDVELNINKEFFDSRGVTIITRLTHGLIKVLYGKTTCPKHIVDGIVEFASFFYSIGYTPKKEKFADIIYYNPINKNSCNFLLEVLHGSTENVEFVILLKNRILVKLVNENICLKYALNGFGANENLNEYDFYASNPSEFIAKPLGLENNNLILRQEFNYLPLTSNIIKINSNIDENIFIEDKEYNTLLIEIAKLPESKIDLKLAFRGLPDFIFNSYKKRLNLNTSLKIETLKKSALSVSKSKESFQIVNFAEYLTKD